jgi:hypothetical protein
MTHDAFIAQALEVFCRFRVYLVVGEKAYRPIKGWA